MYQHPTEPHVPVLVTAQFVALSMHGFANTTAVLCNPATPSQIAEAVQTQRACEGRKCALHRGFYDVSWADPLRYGENLLLHVPPPGERSHDALHYDQRVASLFSPAIPATTSQQLRDMPVVIQELVHKWRQFAQLCAINLEYSISVTTWFLDGRLLWYNPESREIQLPEDFSTWDAIFRQTWHEHIDRSALLDVVFVTPVPPPNSLSETRLLLLQNLPLDEAGCVIAVYDSEPNSGNPVACAAVVPTFVQSSDITHVAAFVHDCSINPSEVSCDVRQDGQALDGTALFPVASGMSFQIIVKHFDVHANNLGHDRTAHDSDFTHFMQT